MVINKCTKLNIFYFVIKVGWIFEDMERFSVIAGDGCASIVHAIFYKDIEIG